MPYIRKDLSFADVISHDSVVAYLPLVATTTGDEVIRQRCPGLQVYPAHSLDSRYSLISQDSILWPEDLRDSAVEVLYSASKRAGIVDDIKDGWKGFGRLRCSCRVRLQGLAMVRNSFEHRVAPSAVQLMHRRGLSSAADHRLQQCFSWDKTIRSATPLATAYPTGPPICSSSM